MLYHCELGQPLYLLQHKTLKHHAFVAVYAAVGVHPMHYIGEIDRQEQLYNQLQLLVFPLNKTIWIIEHNLFIVPEPHLKIRHDHLKKDIQAP